MSAQVDLTERELKVGVIKIAISLVMLVSIIAFVASLVAGEGQQFAISTLLIMIALNLAANGVVAVLKIIDWVETRGKRSNG